MKGGCIDKYFMYLSYKKKYEKIGIDFDGNYINNSSR